MREKGGRDGERAGTGVEGQRGGREEHGRREGAEGEERKGRGRGRGRAGRCELWDSTSDCWWVYHAIMIMVQRPEGDPAVIDVNYAERLEVLHTLAHSSQSNYSDI